ncbi:hypothetical protein BRADI_1g27481v3 [Brachypodium distachyon]|uniref:Uncharacterized protein n=1 Tax=Brachypodium distachyon TaxID=15368 RepID=A0A2K2DLF4_BRADI|nr:hypothetical protein BRADI_1g27481v3 [Brachypodium distachyon]
MRATSSLLVVRGRRPRTEAPWRTHSLPQTGISLICRLVAVEVSAAGPFWPPFRPWLKVTDLSLLPPCHFGLHRVLGSRWVFDIALRK